MNILYWDLSKEEMKKKIWLKTMASLAVVTEGCVFVDL